MVIYLCQKHIKWVRPHKNQYREVYKFMRKTVKKLTAVGLTLTSVMGLVACGNNGASTENKSTVDWANVEKPEAFTVMVDGTVPRQEEWGDKFDEQLKELTSLDFTVTRPDHNSYYDAVANSMLDASAMPDVIILSSDYLALYASQGLLWDMTDAWNNSATKASGRLIADAEKIMQANYVRGVDGEKALYGFVPTRGNGCCTYVKEAWATAAGYTKADLQKQMSYDDFYKMLKKMKEAKGVDYVISAPGFYSKEAPYTNYLPEFYQNAQFTFYYDQAQGKYVDGFSAKEMKDALQRIQNAVKDGLINKESSTKTTATARNDFKSTDPKTESGVFTYWAGQWAETLRGYLKGVGLDDSIIPILPVKELGKYAERLSPSWCITSHAAETGKAEGIFKYFLDKMLDGGDIQTLWEYGPKGYYYNVKDDGSFEFLPKKSDPKAKYSKAHLDCNLVLAGYGDGKKDPGMAAQPANVTECSEMFFKNSQLVDSPAMTEEVGKLIGDINTQRYTVVDKVARGEWSVDEGMKQYTDTVGSKVDAALKSLNTQFAGK
jgi:putative aldouronate transport system substrate-binding protein